MEHMERCILKFAIVSAFCRNPGFDWVAAFHSSIYRDSPKILLLQREIKKSGVVGSWTMPSKGVEFPTDKDEIDISVLKVVHEDLGESILFFASPETMIFQDKKNEGVITQYYIGKWEALPGGVSIGAYDIKKSPFTGYGWFTLEEVRHLTMTDSDRAAAKRVLSNPMKFIGTVV
mgnify:CR=1 FL=1